MWRNIVRTRSRRRVAANGDCNECKLYGTTARIEQGLRHIPVVIAAYRSLRLSRSLEDTVGLSRITLTEYRLIPTSSALPSCMTVRTASYRSFDVSKIFRR